MNSTEKDNEQIIDLLFQLGSVYLENEEYDNAIDKFKKIIELGEENEKVYLNLSIAYILKEQFNQETQEIFEKSLQFEPENPLLNVTLSQLYLEKGREDEKALQVYQVALKQNPQNADDIISKLVKVSFQQGNIDVARDLMQQFINIPEKISNFLPLYIINEWKNQGFDQVNKYLKKLIETQDNLSYYRWLVVNFLQAEKQSLAPFELSLEDLNLCNKYLTSINTFDQLLDIYLYPAVEGLLLKNSRKFQGKALNPVEEYEIFLSEDALSNIWNKALNREDEHQNTLILHEGEILEKLTSWLPSNHLVDEDVESEKEEPDKINQIHNQAETLTVMRLKGISTDEVSEALSISMKEISEIEKTFVNGFKSKDGFILFWKDANCPVRMAINFLQTQSLQNGLNSDKGCEVQFLIHKLSKRGKDKNICYDLQTALSTFQFEQELFLQDNHADQSITGIKHQIFVTAPLKEKISDQGLFSLEPIPLSAHHPTNEKTIQIYKLIWDDDLVKMKKGVIQNIGQLKLLRELNPNQVFTSFKAIDTFLDRLVIVKILRTDFKITNKQNSLPELFLREAKFLGKISHPNIGLVYDIGKEQDFCFIAREYIDGNPLEVQRLINHKINWERTLKICLDIAQTLKYTHEQNIFHGRLQPNNIFMTNNNEVKLTDFQITSFAIPLNSYQGSIPKSLSYSAPEQIENSTFDHQSDIFSLGVIMYEMLTDVNPFADDNRDKLFNNIMNKTPEPLTSHNSELPEELNAIVLKAIEKSPKKRYKNMGEMEKELKEVIAKFGD